MISAGPCESGSSERILLLPTCSYCFYCYCYYYYYYCYYYPQASCLDLNALLILNRSTKIPRFNHRDIPGNRDRGGVALMTSLVKERSPKLWLQHRLLQIWPKLLCGGHNVVMDGAGFYNIFVLSSLRHLCGPMDVLGGWLCELF